MTLMTVANGTATLPASTAETAIVNTPPDFSGPDGGNGNVISGIINITAGTGTTSITLKVRQGVGITGTQVGVNLSHALAAGSAASIPFMVQDTTSSGAQQYTISVVQNGATAAGTLNYGIIQVLSDAGILG